MVYTFSKLPLPSWVSSCQPKRLPGSVDVTALSEAARESVTPTEVAATMADADATASVEMRMPLSFRGELREQSQRDDIRLRAEPDSCLALLEYRPSHLPVRNLRSGGCSGGPFEETRVSSG